MSPFDCGYQAQVEHRLGCRLGKAEPVSNIEMRAGDGFDTALGEEAVLGRVDGLGIGRNRRGGPNDYAAVSRGSPRMSKTSLSHLS